MSERPPYRYHGSIIHGDRLEKRQDHCDEAATVHRLSDLVKGGVVCVPGTSVALTSPSLKAEGVFIFAIDMGGEMHLAPDGGRRSQGGAIKHETLLHNKDVLAAGEIYFANGVVAGINDLSGTYATAGEIRDNPAFRDAIRIALERAGATPSSEVFGMLQ